MMVILSFTHIYRNHRNSDEVSPDFSVYPAKTAILSTRPAILLAALLTALALLCTLPAEVRGAEEPYGYPYTDPYVATVIGTPEELQAEVPKTIPVREREVTIFKDRPLPDILWYGKRLRYSFAAQKREAELVFIVPGMGAGYSEAKNRFLQKVFFQAGFHVVSLPSSTHPYFIPAASTGGIPGHPREDAEDLYRVMQLIVRDIREDVPITGFHVAGYSLGAVHAAYLADLDRERGLFRFDKIVLINPPASLYNSMLILDEMIRKIPGGEERFEEFFDEAFKAFASIYRLGEPVDFTGDFLYRGRRPNDENLAALIGLSFRLSMANLAFTSDVFTDSGYIKPKNLRLSTTDSLTQYFNVADTVTFSAYFQDMFKPYFLEKTPGLTEQQLVEQLSLKSVEPLLAASPTIFLFHNADDVTLRPGEVEQMRKIFGSRAKIYPYGGHCGNLTYRTNVADLLAVFREMEADKTEELTADQPPTPDEPETAGGEAREKPPILTMDVAPVPPKSPEAEPAEFTAPKHAYAYTSEVEAEVARRRITEEKTQKEPEVVPARRGIKPGLSSIIDVYDPLEPMNRGLYKFNAVFDEYVFLPVTRAYEFITPVFVQDRISGIFSNIIDFRSFSNALLQLRPVKSGKILTRFLINSTVGLAGMWDPATRVGFPKYVEDFGQTLGRYGLGPGPFIMLPILGPSSARDTTGLAADATAQYFYLYQTTDMNVNSEYGTPYTTMNAVDQRHNIPFRYYQTGSPFEYDLLRLLYKKKRELDIEQ